MTRTPLDTAATYAPSSQTVTLKMTPAEAAAVAYVLGRADKLAPELTTVASTENISPTYHSFCALADLFDKLDGQLRYGQRRYENADTIRRDYLTAIDYAETSEPHVETPEPESCSCTWSEPPADPENGPEAPHQDLDEACPLHGRAAAPAEWAAYDREAAFCDAAHRDSFRRAARRSLPSCYDASIIERRVDELIAFADEIDARHFAA